MREGAFLGFSLSAKFIRKYIWEKVFRQGYMRFHKLDVPELPSRKETKFLRLRAAPQFRHPVQYRFINGRYAPNDITIRILDDDGRVIKEGAELDISFPEQNACLLVRFTDYASHQRLVQV